MLFLLFELPIGFVLLIIITVVISMYEFLKLTQVSTTNKIISIITLTLSSYIALISPTIFYYLALTKMAYVYVLVVVLLWWANNFRMVANYPKLKPLNVFTPIKAVLLFTPLFFLFIFEPYLILLLLLIVWGADSFAYFAGKAFGRHKLAPNLSGGKTIEGVVGGLIGVLLITGTWMVYYHETNWKFLLLALVTGIFSVVGDLHESAYKREAGVKDSGNLLPGHGGVLDRIDGLLAATPVFVTGIILLL
ncbi:Phosphatidate cytidylyltransferase [uncultured Candidatus Thioglobus sp.]|nr:Phosphatidate cytidylyltransferase [uncultured Candidatus Thioglobus sp.]